MTTYTPASSGTYVWAPALSDVVLDAFERLGIRPNALTTEQYQSANRSMNYVLSRWANRGVNLWRVVEQIVYMPQGVSSYAVDPSAISVLDTFRRQYQVGASVNVAPSFSTTANSALVTILTTGPTPVAGGYAMIGVPVSVGGLVLQGFYQVQSVPASGSFTVKASSNATSTVTNGGAVPAFSTTQGSNTVTVTLANHGLLAGEAFQVQVPVYVGGLVIQGLNYVASVTDANDFTIISTYPAGSTATVSENSNQTQIATQSLDQGLTQNGDPVDILMYPLSRNDYAAIPDKLQQGPPTSFWFDRTLTPTINVWPVPDGNGPYELHYYICRRVQDASASGGQIGDMPQRFYEAFAADLAAHLAMKWAPERAVLLTAYAKETWQEAADEDREKVGMYIAPEFAGYFH